MYTVVIAEQEHLDGIQEHSAFLLPFMKGKNIAFCAWDTEGQTLETAVPSLSEAVSRHAEWRAVIVCNEQGLKQQNPFNIVSYQIPERTDDSVPESEQTGGEDQPQDQVSEQKELSNYEKQQLINDAIEEYHRKKKEILRDFLQSNRENKHKAYDEASQQPLTRLVTFLCESPVIEGGRNKTAEDDPEYEEYLENCKYKESLREKIIAGREVTFSYPKEVICLAKRTCNDYPGRLSSIWNPHLEMEYSQFYDWNMYYDKMRYLVFDILPKSHQDYAFQYIRFLYLVLILATYGPAEGALNPNRVYRVECENDETALRRLIVSYDERLKLTDEQLQREIYAIESKERPRLTDRDASSIFCANVTVPVTVDSSFERSDLYSDTRQFGLSGNCPAEESAVWEADYKRSRKSLHYFLKQPRRALKRATESLKALSVVDLERVPELNRFQVEDVEEYVSTAEVKMSRMQTSDFYDVSRYDKQLEEADKVVRDKIETRMTKTATIVLGVIALVLFAIGYLPLIFNNLGNVITIGTAIIFLALVLGVLAGVALICLFFLRRALRQKVDEYNGTMNGIVSEVDQSMTDFSRYLGYAGNVMRGMSVLKYYRNHTDPEETKARVRKKHQMDIRQLRAELQDTFGQYLTDPDVIDKEGVRPYPYNFDREVDFKYPLPYTDKEATTIRYMKPGNQITLPVDFVQSITTRLEELYDN